jgi:uncharacterized protein YcbK (DUF882 family)
MRHAAAARTRSHGTLRPIAFGLLVVSAAVIGTLVYQSTSTSEPSVREVRRGHHGGGATAEVDGAVPKTNGTVTRADGVLPDGVTVFDDRYPGVANLDPALLDALRRAAADAADDDVEFVVDSGWRSRAYQEQLLHEAVSEYGSEQEAARWVATPNTSAHVAGEAVDVGPSDAAAWLSEHGAVYGLCQIYGNEPWHYELRPDAAVHGCPPMYADPTQDPRMQQ